MMAVGVARPSAHGQAITSTATMLTMAMVKPALPTKNQPRNVSSAMPITTGTKTPETRSASAWIGALEPCASSTSRMICASAVSAPTLVACTRSRPEPLSVAPMTSSPGASSRPAGSRRSASTRRPTSGRPAPRRPPAIFSPGRTSTVSPTRTSSIGTSCSTPSRTTRAVRRPQAHQGLDGRARAPLGHRFQVLADPDQGDDQRRGLEVGHRRRAGPSTKSTATL